VIGEFKRNNAVPLVILTVYLCLLGCGAREERVITATAALQQALKIQPMLQNSRGCLGELAGWVSDPEYGRGVLATQVIDTQTPLTFECDQEHKAFSVTIRYGFDDYADVSGPFDGPLRINYGHFSAPESKVIPQNPDVRGLAELLAYGGN
jgi:hypothetical protein